MVLSEGACGLPPRYEGGDVGRARAALVREDEGGAGDGGVPGHVVCRCSTVVRAETGGDDPGPVHDLGADDVLGSVMIAGSRRGQSTLAAATITVKLMDGPVDPMQRCRCFDAPKPWLWLFKWCVLAVPHYPYRLGCTWCIPLLTIVAGVAILFTGRYRAPSSTSTWVLRWSSKP